MNRFLLIFVFLVPVNLLAQQPTLLMLGVDYATMEGQSAINSQLTGVDAGKLRKQFPLFGFGIRTTIGESDFMMGFGLKSNFFLMDETEGVRHTTHYTPIIIDLSVGRDLIGSRNFLLLPEIGLNLLTDYYLIRSNRLSEASLSELVLGNSNVTSIYTVNLAFKAGLISAYLSDEEISYPVLIDAGFIWQPFDPLGAVSGAYPGKPIDLVGFPRSFNTLFYFGIHIGIARFNDWGNEE